jgi:hypothetical protein
MTSWVEALLGSTEIKRLRFETVCPAPVVGILFLQALGRRAKHGGRRCCCPLLVLFWQSPLGSRICLVRMLVFWFLSSQGPGELQELGPGSWIRPTVAHRNVRNVRCPTILTSRCDASLSIVIALGFGVSLLLLPHTYNTSPGETLRSRCISSKPSRWRKRRLVEDIWIRRNVAGSFWAQSTCIVSLDLKPKMLLAPGACQARQPEALSYRYSPPVPSALLLRWGGRTQRLGNQRSK